MANFSLQDVLAEIDSQAAASGVDPRTAKAVVIAENTGSGSMKSRTSYSGDATSSVGASGIMQVMPATARGLQQAGFLPADWKHDPSNLKSQVQAGLAAIKEKTTRMNDPSNLDELASVYNGSSEAHRVYKKSGEFIREETRNYADKLRRATMELDGNDVDSSGRRTATSDPRVIGGAAPVSGTSNRVSTSSKSFDMGQLDKFMSMIGQSQDAYTAAGNVVSDQGAVRDSSSVAQVKAISEAGVAAGQTAMAEAVARAAGDEKRAEILRRTNLDPTSLSSEMDRAMSAINTTDDQLTPMKREIDSRMAVGFFDNPLAWIVNQTRLPGMVNEYNGIVGVQKDAVERFKTIDAIATGQQARSANTEADLILKLGVAKSAEAAAKATMASTKEIQDNAGAITRDALVTAQISGTKVSLQGQALKTTQETVSISEGETAKSAAAKQEALDVTNVNKILVAAGGTPLSAQQYKTMPPAKREILTSAATSGKFGKNFAESFELVANDGNGNNMATKGGSAVVKWMQDTAAKAEKAAQTAAMPAAQTGKVIDISLARRMELNRLQETYQRQMISNMRGADDSNPAKLDYAAIAKNPALANNSVAIWLKEFGPGGTSPMMTTVDEEFLLSKFTTSVVNGAGTAPQAAKAISDFYQLATNQQAISTSWPMFGLVKAQKTYPIVVPENVMSGFGPSKTATPIDLGDAMSVERILTMRAVAQIRAKTLANTNPFTQPGAGVGAFNYKQE